MFNFKELYTYWNRIFNSPKLPKVPDPVKTFLEQKLEEKMKNPKYARIYNSQLGCQRYEDHELSKFMRSELLNVTLAECSKCGMYMGYVDG